MPAVFLGHGSPMNALEENRYTASWLPWSSSASERTRCAATTATARCDAESLDIPLALAIEHLQHVPGDAYEQVIRYDVMTSSSAEQSGSGAPPQARPMPAVFFGHGSPMNALEENRYTEAWRRFGETIPRPRAILSVSAHWFVNATAVTAMPRPRTIHDFYGFPQPLFDVEYPAPGSPELAEEVAEIVKPQHVGLDQDSWGIDHGTWSVLVHAFPKADIPVVQLSIHALRDFDSHFDLGARLAPLRERGVLIVGSGNVVHNLRALNWGQPAGAFDWARRFDEAAQTAVTKKPSEVPALREHADYARSAPTPDHFIPLLYIAGLAGAANRPLELLVDGYAYGSISMAAYTLDAKCPTETADTRPAAGLPDPAVIPPVDTNI